MVVNAAVLILLLYESVVDIIKRKINIVPTMAVGVFGLLMNRLVYKRPLWWLAGLAAGSVLMLAALVSKEKIGYGDGIVFLMIGVCVEPLTTLWVLWISMFAVGIMGSVGIIMGKRGRNSQIPYIPFVAAAYIVVGLLRMKAGG